MSHGGRKNSKYSVASIHLFSPVFSESALNYADLKPLDFIGFTGTPFRKIAPTIDFYFFGGHIPVCDFLSLSNRRIVLY